MRHITFRLAVASLLVLGLSWALVCADTPADNPRQHAQAAILDLAEHLNDRDVAERAQKIVNEHDSCDISTIFTVKNRGGLGIGKLAPADHRDSVQYLITLLSRRRDTTEQHFQDFQAD